jgi:hypothetical protein
MITGFFYPIVLGHLWQMSIEYLEITPSRLIVHLIPFIIQIRRTVYLSTLRFWCSVVTNGIKEISNPLKWDMLTVTLYMNC